MTPLPKSPNTKIAKGSTLSLSFSKENSHKKKYKGKIIRNKQDNNYF